MTYLAAFSDALGTFAMGFLPTLIAASTVASLFLFIVEAADWIFNIDLIDLDETEEV